MPEVVDRHHCSTVGPQNERTSDIFGHNLNRRLAMQTLAVIAILALLTITGAAYTDQLMTSDQHTAQRVN
jgi:hypothetical protein